MSKFLRPHGLYSPWNSPGQNTGVGSFPFSRGSSQPRDQTQVSRIAGRFFTSWARRKAQKQTEPGTNPHSASCQLTNPVQLWAQDPQLPGRTVTTLFQGCSEEPISLSQGECSTVFVHFYLPSYLQMWSVLHPAEVFKSNQEKGPDSFQGPFHSYILINITWQFVSKWLENMVK